MGKTWRKDDKLPNSPMSGSERPRRHQTQGANPLGVFGEILGREVDDSTGMRNLTLVFGSRKAGEGHQIVSVLEDDTKIYPLIERWVPSTKRKIPCHVLVVEQRGSGKRVGFALPVSLREAARLGEWKPPVNNVKELIFRKDQDSGALYSFAGNGKRVIVPEDAGIEITDAEIKDKAPVPVMVVERMTAFVVRCRVAPELIAELTLAETDTKAQGALILRAEAAGATFQSADPYLLYWGKRTFDVCSELGVERNATMAQIQDAYDKLAVELHPDKRLAAERTLLGGKEPTKETVEEITFEFTVIQAAYERLKLLRTREEAAHRYCQKGADRYKIRKSLTVAALSKITGKPVEVLREALTKIGYGVESNNANLEPTVALTLCGYLLTKDEETPGTRSTLQPAVMADDQPNT